MKDSGTGPEVNSEARTAFGAGVIRYRTWPARRHPWRLVAVAVVAVGVATAVALAWGNAWWALIAGLGLVGATAPFFFPTEVAIDGARLSVRQLGMPREYDLRQFRRVEVVTDVVTRAELSTGALHSPLEAVHAMGLPLPHAAHERDQVVTHLRRWVGRRPTGQFRLDDDHAPEDDLVP
jgi:hypothetical protein